MTAPAWCSHLPPGERRLWMRLLAPDDAADLIQEAPANARAELLALLDEVTQTGSQRSARLCRRRRRRPDEHPLLPASPRHDRWRGDQLSAPRRPKPRQRTTYYAYVVDHEERLLGVITFRDLIVAPADKLIREVMRTEIISAREDMDQEALSKLFMRHHLLMIPVVDCTGTHQRHCQRRRYRRCRPRRSHRRHSQDRRRRVPRRAVLTGFSACA